MEENPEMFGQVIMLYINCQINGHNVKAFVDSGAQMTIMSSECARNCGLTDLIDVRFSGIAQAIFKKTSKSSSTENPVFQVYMYIEKLLKPSQGCRNAKDFRSYSHRVCSNWKRLSQ